MESLSPLWGEMPQAEGGPPLGRTPSAFGSFPCKEEQGLSVVHRSVT